jgi:chromate reductase, NAD(P)H dehydrogenase (quinone)
MPHTPRILAFAGTARTQSWNARLLPIAAQGAQSRGAEVTILDMRDYPMPLFDEDAESSGGMPEVAARFRRLLIEHDGFLIACPEYNSSITPLLKNAIDWASRSEKKGDPPLEAFRGKAAALMATSPGSLGGLRGLVTVRSILGNIGVHVLPTQVAVPSIHTLFDDNGNMTEDAMRTRLESLGSELADLTAKLNA